MTFPDVGEDWQVDPVMRRACEPVTEKACSYAETSDGRKMTCLSSLLESTSMTPECEIVLKQSKYFINKKFKLDTQLYRSCKDDAAYFCHVRTEWANEGKVGPKTGPMVLACLYRVAADEHLRLETDCQQVSLNFISRKSCKSRRAVISHLLFQYHTGDTVYDSSSSHRR